MPGTENDNLAIQVAELRSDVRHIQSDTTEIKADLRLTNARIDRVDEKIESLREKTEQGFTSLRKETGELIDKLEQRIDDVKDSLGSAKIWALGMYIGLAGSLFYVLARGFKWL